MKGLPRLVRFLPKVVLALLVSVSAEGYKKLAVWLNDMGRPGASGSTRVPALASPATHAPPRPAENYRLESAYEKNLIIKVVLVSAAWRAPAQPPRHPALSHPALSTQHLPLSHPSFSTQPPTSRTLAHLPGIH